MLLCLLIGASAGSEAQGTGPQTVAGVTVRGVVTDEAGRSVSGATVVLAGNGQPAARETTTGPQGIYTFSMIPKGSYRLRANRASLESSDVQVDMPLARKDQSFDLVIKDAARAAVPAKAMEFSDQPTFTVAGVTDWTAVGGHGSDANLRTSEDLARQTLTLRVPAAPADATHESDLRKAVAAAPGSFAASNELGEFYLPRGRYKEALESLQAAYRLRPGDARNEYALAQALQHTGELAKAREHAEHLLASGSKAESYRLLGQIDEQSGNPLAAVKEDEQAVRLEPSEENYFAWGSELLIHRAVWQAVDIFQDGVKKYPNSARMFTALGGALFAGARYEQAAVAICHASDLNPQAQEPYLFLGKIAIAAPTALACAGPRLTRFQEQQPDNAFANYYDAMALWKANEQGAHTASLSHIEHLLHKAVSLDPHCAEAYVQLGILSASLRENDQAIDFYKRAIEVNPQSADAHYRLGVVYDRTGEPAKARQEFELHEQIEKQQAVEVERQRQEIKQFMVVSDGKTAAPGAR